MKVRLNKHISSSGVTSRRKADDLILQGRVEVNDEIVKKLGFLVDAEADIIRVDGTELKRTAKEYYMLYKPAGFITAVTDDRNRKTVVELIKTKGRIFPVGRLDYDTTGLLFLTNDGDFANLLMHPSSKIQRTYEVKLDKEIFENNVQRLLEGVVVDKKKRKFASVELSPKNPRRVTVTCYEGINHFVKKMFKAIGFRVIKLKRTAFGHLTLEIMNPGDYRKLEKHEVNKFYSLKK